MNIALDFDETYTNDPLLWDMFIKNALERGHDIRIVTYRKREMTDPALTWLSLWIPVIFTEYTRKRTFTANMGWFPDVWIDDCPELIVEELDRNAKIWMPSRSSNSTQTE